MRIGLVQSNIVWEDKEQNFLLAKTIIKLQASEGTDIIFFPEMSFTGFSMNTDLTGETNMQTVERISSYARKYKISIGFGWVRRKKDLCENVYSVVDSDGKLISEYVKIHPFSFSGEDKYFCGGNTIITYEINGIPFSTFICYDLRFPEAFRAVAEKNHAIVIPACWPAKRSEHWKSLLRARAIENQVYVFAINCFGNIGGQYYSGDSCIINPDGEIVKMLTGQEGVIIYDLIDDVDKYRALFPVLKDRKPEMYSKVIRF